MEKSIVFNAHIGTLAVDKFWIYTDFMFGGKYDIRQYFKDSKGGEMKIHHSNGAIYGMGVLGAAFYFLQHATTLEAVLIGLLKSILWPGVILYQVLTLLKL